MTSLETITATFRVVTPMFLGDAERQASRLALQSFKGALRFWWRALRWPTLLASSPGDQRRALEELWRSEAELFGAGGDETRTFGQAKIHLSAHQRDLMLTSRRLIGPGVEYLTYGVRERQSFAPGQRLDIRLAWLPKRLSTAELRDLLDALELLGMVGGLGARTRRGCGSIALDQLQGTAAAGRSVPTELASYTRRMEQLLNRHAATSGGAADLPPYSAFGPDAEVQVYEATPGLTRAVGVQGPPVRDWLDAMNCLGGGLIWYRSNGQGGRVRIHQDGQATQSASSAFSNDHAWFDSFRVNRQAWRRSLSALPERFIFGLPHNYFSKKRGILPQLKISIPSERETLKRRASSLLLHIHEFAGRYFFVSVVLPALFQPQGRSQLQLHVQYQQQVTDPRNGRPRWVSDPQDSGSANVSTPAVTARSYQLLRAFPQHSVRGDALFTLHYPLTP